MLGIVISNDGKGTSAKLPVIDPKTATVDEIKQAMLDGGVWPFLTQRPYGVLANPSLQPRDIFVTALNTAPLAPNFDIIVKGQENDFQTGLAALAKLSKGKVYVGAAASTTIPAVNGVEKVTVEGPHPAGNVGVQINNFKPINKGEIVWTANAQDVIVIGRILNGKCDFSRIITIAGSEIVAPAYAKVQAGAPLADILDGKVKHVEYKQRVINGDVLISWCKNTQSFWNIQEDCVHFNLICHLTRWFNGFDQCFWQLVRARCWFISTSNTFDLVNHILRLLSFYKRRNALKITVASAHELHILYDVVITQFDMYKPRTSPLGLVP